MAYTVTKLITEAYYLSGRVSRGLSTVTGQQIQTGLTLLNACLAVKSANNRLIPYFTEYNFTSVINQEEYFIPGLITVDTLTFVLNTVRYPMNPVSRRNYQGSTRANNIDSLPMNYSVERALNGANIFMYFLPDQPYVFTLWGKFSLASVVLNQDLETTLDNYYIEYLRYALCEYICNDQNITMQPQNALKLAEYEKILVDISPPDLSIAKKSAFTSRGTRNWGDVNLGHGWRGWAF